MNRQQIKSSLLLLLTAVIWGTAFVAQSVGMNYVGPFTFNCVRSLIGGVVLIPCIFLLRRIRPDQSAAESGTDKAAVAKKGTDQTAAKNGPDRKRDKAVLVQGGIWCGILLFVASNLQQFGIAETTVGKAGFITALYIVIVPIAGLLFHKKCTPLIWGGVVLAVFGLYFLCMDESFSIQRGDFLVFLCAIAFSAHIMVIDHYTERADGVKMSCIQFFVCGLLSGICMLIFENPDIANILAAWQPVLYAGVLSCGVAYTLQIVGQKGMNPTVASLILSLESVISALAGLVILHQSLSGKETLGCVLMFCAIILAQLPWPLFKRKRAR